MRTSPGYAPVLSAAAPVHRSAAPDLGRAPAAAASSAPASPGTPTVSRVSHGMRASQGSSEMVSAAQLVAGATTPNPSAAFALAGD